MTRLRAVRRDAEGAPAPSGKRHGRHLVDLVCMAIAAVMLAALVACWWYRRRALAAEALADRLAAEAQAQAYAANHDALTGLANRRAFYQRGEQLLRDPHELPAVGVLLDLDGFKQVNDTLGHAAGDEVLAVLGRRLSGFARDGLVGRLGGDEFAALLRYEPPAGASYPILEQMAAAVAAPILVAGHQVRVTASVGHTTVSTTTALTEVLRNADAAMYRAKANGRSVTRINPVGALPPEQAALRFSGISPSSGRHAITGVTPGSTSSQSAKNFATSSRTRGTTVIWPCCAAATMFAIASGSKSCPGCVIAT